MREKIATMNIGEDSVKMGKDDSIEDDEIVDTMYDSVFGTPFRNRVRVTRTRICLNGRNGTSKR